ncbi:ABC transporter permease [Periweissella cryptocerci]|uniref:ABC transporter permease n=1 Tax=Periweissella cryptocerci TaxID=2506420 RepID=A0A4P6YTN7_9LACO|nr:ABC transporter permease [Periweissella cryptocerci]QBO36124.1 ABC transporter permease [Periweissella cryptocerci]
MIEVTRKDNGLVAILSVVLGLLVGAIIMLVSGFNPIAGYGSLLQSAFGTPQSIGEVLRQMSPLLLTGAGFMVAQAAGFFNIGLSGQAMAGWFGSVWFALSFPTLSKLILLPTTIIIGIALGAVAGMIPGWLRARFGSSEVITTIMFNYIILYVGNSLVQNTFKKSIKATTESSVLISNHASLRASWLTNLTNGSSLNIGLFIAIIVVVVVWFVMKKTTLGLEITSVGLNDSAARYAGISDRRTATIAMVISGGLAGLAGVVDGLGTYQNVFVQNAVPGVGFDGMAVALLGGGSYLGLVGGAALFSVLKIGGLGMPIFTGVPTELVDIIIAAIIFFVGINYVVRLLIARFRKVTTKPNPLLVPVTANGADKAVVNGEQETSDGSESKKPTKGDEA